MHTNILSLFILAIAFVEFVLSCRYDQLVKCKNYHVLTEAKVVLIDPDNINSECKRFEGLFTCVTQYLGSCDLKSRMRWQPIQRQITTLCTTSKTAYLATGTCWADEEMGYTIEDCNVDLIDEYDMDPCGTLDRYIECLQESAEDLCSEQAGKVLADLGTSYVSMIRETIRCNGTSTTGAQPTTSAAASTKQPASDHKYVTDQTRVFSSLTDRVGVKEDEGEPARGGEDTTTTTTTAPTTSTSTGTSAATLTTASASTGTSAATLTTLHTTISTSTDTSAATLTTLTTTTPTTTPSPTAGQNTVHTQAVISSAASVTHTLFICVSFIWVIAEQC